MDLAFKRLLLVREDLPNMRTHYRLDVPKVLWLSGG